MNLMVTKIALHLYLIDHGTTLKTMQLNSYFNFVACSRHCG